MKKGFIAALGLIAVLSGCAYDRDDRVRSDELDDETLKTETNVDIYEQKDTPKNDTSFDVDPDRQMDTPDTQ